MNSAKQYRIENEKLLTEYEERVRKWLLKKGKKELSEKIPFFRDGVTCPEVWFEKGNNFRPLFVLKEVSLGIDTIEELESYLKTWGNPKYFEFVENPFDDIKIGKFTQWRRIAKLAKGLKEIHCGADMCDYYKYDLGYKDGGEEYQGNIEGYKKYFSRTSNQVYNEIINQIAVLEIKKIGAGTNVASELSVETEYYTSHIEPFEELICKQIMLIDPTVIICLGRENGKCISEQLKPIKEKTGNRIWIDGYHHIMSSNEKFYYKPIREYKKELFENFN